MSEEVGAEYYIEKVEEAGFVVKEKSEWEKMERLLKEQEELIEKQKKATEEALAIIKKMGWEVK